MMVMEREPEMGWWARWRARRAMVQSARAAAEHPTEFREEPEPVAVHEHITVEDPGPSRAARARIASDELQDREADRVYHAYVDVRRHRRFTLAGMFMLGVTALAAVWLVYGAASGATQFFTLTSTQLAIAGIAVVVVGLGLTVGAARGIAGALMLAWLAGLAVLLAALNEANTAGVVDAGMAGIAGLLGLFGVLTMMATTIALTSWRGVRVERRILGPGPGSQRGRVS